MSKNGNGMRTGSHRITVDVVANVRPALGATQPEAVQQVTVNSLDQLNALHASQVSSKQQKQMELRAALMQRAVETVRNSGLTKNDASPIMRSALYNFLLDGPRNIDADCGYPEWLTPDHYRLMYEREGIAKRVVECEPKESWAMEPEVYEDEDPDTDTPFEAAWKELNKLHNFWHYLQRIDILSGIGQYGILLLGIDDGLDLKDPIDGVNDDGTFSEPATERKLMYLRPFSEEVVFCKIRETDPSNPRFGQPKIYTIHFRDFPNWGIQAGEIIARDVHWSRVIHVADNRKISEIYGVPRMHPVWNRLFDLRKTYASCAEAWWKGAFPGMAFEVNPELADQGVEMDTTSIREEMQKYMNGLQRYIAITGVSAKTLPPQLVDPTGTIEALLKSIAIALGIPYRVLFGSEEAKLASGQDAVAWAKRLSRRQREYITPLLIRPFVDRLINIGVLPKPAESYDVDWPDLNSPDDATKAQTALVKTNAISTYVQSGAAQLMPPREFFVHILGMTTEEAEQMIEAAEEFGEQMDLEQQAEGGLEGEPPPEGEEGEIPEEGAAGATGAGQGQLGIGNTNDTGNALEQKGLAREGTAPANFPGKKKPTQVESTIVHQPSLNAAIVQNKVVKKRGRWYVYSEDGKKRLGGPYESPAEARARLKQIEYFKRK